MALYSLEGEPQPLTGQREYWELFRSLQGSRLHEAIVAKLQPHLMDNHIDSRITGHEILEALESESPQLVQLCPEEQRGGLFGMILWNLLAQEDSGDWRFYRMSNAWDETQWTTYFRPRSNES